MNTVRRLTVSGGVLLACGLPMLGMLGCGGGPKLPPMAKVSGTVTFDGKPLPRGMVEFTPEGSTVSHPLPPAVGAIGSDGRFTMYTAGVAGAVVGQHKVSVEAREDVDLNKVSWAPSIIPEKYGNPAESGLSFEVKAGQTNVCDLNLSSKP
jgi:hypothetical protein